MTLLQEDVILKLDNSAQIFNSLSDIPGDVTDAEQLLEVQYGTMYDSVLQMYIQTQGLGLFFRKRCMFWVHFPQPF